MADSICLGNIQDLYEANVNMMVAKRALPDVVAFLIDQRGAAQAEQDLKDIARIITQRLFLAWYPKSRTPFKIFQEMMRIFFGNKKIKGKVLERKNGKPSKIAIRDYNCPICPDKKKGEEVKVSEIHYCIAISGTMEGVISYLISENAIPYMSVSCTTTKSVGSGDDLCEHILSLELKEE